MIFRRNKYRRHIKTLCRDHKIALKERGDSHGWAKVHRRIVSVPKIVNQRSYLTAMHEIGHILLWDARDKEKFPHFYSTKPYILFEEAAAWKWAFDNAMERITYDTRIDALRALHSYHRGVDREDFPWAIYPPKEHYYWELIREYETHCLYPR